MSIRVYIGPWPGAVNQGDRIFIEAGYNNRLRCKELPGARWEPKSKAWHIPATVASAHGFMQAFSGESIEASQDVQDLMGRAVVAENAVMAKTAEDLPDLPVRLSAWQHQRRAFHFAKQLDAALLAMDMGTGKSMVAIALCQEWDAKRVLILCPLSVVGVWPAEFTKHAVNPNEWHIAAGDPRVAVPQRVEQLAKGITTAEKLKKRSVTIINYDAAWRENVRILLKAVAWDVVICDESHRIKSAGGKASRLASGLREIAKRRLALTGTPMPHSPLDIYAQYRFLDPGIFGTSKNRFLNRYAVMGGYENRQVKSWDNTDELQRKFASIAFVVSKEEALPDLPKKMPPTMKSFQLGVKGLRAYKQMEKEFIADVDNDFVVAANALAKSLRLRQIACGIARTDSGHTHQLDDGREKLLEEILLDLPKGEPVVVFSAFHPDLDATERVAEKLGLRFGELSGRRRDGLTHDSKMAPDIDLLGCQIKSGGVGIDLTRACYAIYYSVSWENGDYRQSEDRLHRPGQTRPVRYIHLVAQDTIDLVVYKALESRQNVVNAILTAVKEHQL